MLHPYEVHEYNKKLLNYVDLNSRSEVALFHHETSLKPFFLLAGRPKAWVASWSDEGFTAAHYDNIYQDIEKARKQIARDEAVCSRFNSSPVKAYHDSLSALIKMYGDISRNLYDSLLNYLFNLLYEGGNA